MARNRLNKEWQEVRRNPDPDISLELAGDSFEQWHATIKGPQDSPYEGGHFKLDIVCTANYPYAAPQVSFATKIFHPNVNYNTGELCLDIVKTDWSPAWTLQYVCRAVIALLRDPNPESPLNCDAGNLLRNGDLRGFRSMARMYTTEHAMAVQSPSALIERAPNFALLSRRGPFAGHCWFADGLFLCPTVKVAADIARQYSSAIRYITLLLVFEIRSRLTCGTTTVVTVLALVPLFFAVHRRGGSFRRLHQLIQKLNDKPVTDQMQIWAEESSQMMRSWRSNAQFATSALKALTRQHLTSIAIFTLSLMTDRSVETNIVHYTTVVSALAKRCFWEVALSVVESLPPGISANSFTFNSLVSACSGGSEWAKALHLCEEMRHLGVLPDSITKNVILSACEKGTQWSLALSQCAGQSGQGDLSQTTIRFNSALAALQACQSWKLAVLGFNSMRSSRACPDEYSCSTCINSCQHSWQLAANGLEALFRSGLFPNDVVYGAALNSCEKNSAWSMALQMSNDIQTRRSLSNQYIYNSVISAVDKAGQWTYAVELFDEMPRHTAHDAVTCTVLISACGTRSWTWALAVLHGMSERSIVPTAATYNAVLKACSSNGLDTTLKVWTAIKGLDHPQFPDVLTYNIMISACSDEGAWQFGLEFLSEIAWQGLTADVVTFNSAISACEKLGHWQVALDLVTEMLSLAVLPNGVTFSAAISATVQASKWQEAMYLYSRLVQTELPTVIACNSMLAALGSSSQWQRSLKFLSSMPEYDLQADTITYSEVLTACQRSLQWQHVLEVVQLLQGHCALDAQVCASAIGACALSAQAEDAVRLLETLSQTVCL
ncbi:PEX4 [Symbiodinium sp. CCMP2456]|nr:PEX4 [Symbiodinium sp. CCMP2456]